MSAASSPRRNALRLVPGADQVPDGVDPRDLARGWSVRTYRVRSADGTEIQAWTNDVEGPTVLLCNGLGTNPYAWPALLHPECGVRVISWNHRGTGGSDRPLDPNHVGVTAFVEDAVAVLDEAGVTSCVVLGWSMGVNTAFELATQHPERVRGILAVAGVPGGTFSSMLAPLGVPRFARSALTVGAARALRRVGSLVTPLTQSIPVTSRFVTALSHSGFMLPVADETIARRAISEFLTTPVDWYAHLAVQTSAHQRVSLRALNKPCIFVAGRWDLLASADDMRTAAARIPGAQYVEFNGSHFLPLERPEAIHRLLRELIARVESTNADRPALPKQDGAAGEH